MTNLWAVTLAPLLLAAPATGRNEGVSPEEAVRLRVVLHVALTPDEVALARETAQALLDAAGVRTEWQLCGALESMCSGPQAGWLTVRLLATGLASRHAAGHLVRDGRTGSTALVHVGRHRELLRAVHHSRAGRTNPALSSLRLGHVLGLTIAHEAGHALGLAHAQSGVMRKDAGLDDLLRLRRSELAFMPGQAAQIRRALEGNASRRADSAP